MSGDDGAAALVLAAYERTADAYADRYFDDLSDTPWIDRMIALLPPTPRVLDVGCGPGHFTRYLAAKGCQAEGVDFSGAMIQIARQRVAGTTFHHMDMRDLGFSDASFDAILAAYCLIHVPSPQVADCLREFRRVLQPGGLLLVMGQQGAPDHVETVPEDARVAVFINFFTVESLLNVTQSAGFVPVFVEQVPADDAHAMSDQIIYMLLRSAPTPPWAKQIIQFPDARVGTL